MNVEKQKRPTLLTEVVRQFRKYTYLQYVKTVG